MNKKTFPTLITKYSLFSLLAVIIIIGAYIWQDISMGRYKRPKAVIASDVVSYYNYLPATFIEKDYKFTFKDSKTPKYENGIYWVEKSQNGAWVIKTSMGVAMMYAPFFFIANILAEPLGYEPSGFTVPYAFALTFSCLFYLLIGLLLLRKVLLKYYSDVVVALTLIIIGTGTNLYWYATVEGPMSHSYSFALFCVFLFLIEKWYEKHTWITSVFVGLIFGLIMLIRPTNGLVILVFMLYNITTWKDIPDRLKLFLQQYRKIFVIILCTAIVWLPQLLYWKSVTGDWLYYSYGSGERFFFNDPKMFQVLFSFRRGFLIYTPVMIFSLIGFVFLWKSNRKYFYPILTFCIINLYVVSSWWCWWYGGGFGMRALIESYAFLAIPLAAFLNWVGSRKTGMKIALSILIFAFYAQSLFHTIQFYYGAIYWDSMTKESYFDSFWRVRPSEKFNSFLKKPDYEAAKNGER